MVGIWQALREIGEQEHDPELVPGPSGEFSGSETVKVRMRGGVVTRTEKCVGVS